MKLLHDQQSDEPVACLRELFTGDGTIYLITGYFTYPGFLDIQEEIEAFLDRNPTNELVIVVNATADGFTPRIAREVAELPGSDRVSLLRHPRDSLHAKLYLRDGPEPMAITGSTNLTRVAFEHNIELTVMLDDPEEIAAVTDWANALIAECTRIRRRDLIAPVMMSASIAAWGRKATLLSRGTLTPPPGVIIVLAALVLTGVLLW